MATATVNIPTQVSNHANSAAFPVTGALKTLYIAEDTEKLYRWTGSAYVEVSQGSTSGVTSFNTRTGAVVSTNTDYTKSDVGLSNVDNTSDANKPISTATQNALDGKVDENAAITGATKTKITYDLKGLITSATDATTADIADSTDKRYVTDAQLTVIGNTSGTNTGDNATNSQYSGLAASKEDTSNKVTTFTGNETSVVKFPVVKAILDYFTAANIRSILGISILSGSNTGDSATNSTSNTYADGKVADAINDGITTIAPSQNAVFDALALKANNNSVLRVYANGSALTGTTANSIPPSQSNLIPANTIAVGDILRFITQLTKTGTAGIYTTRIYVNTSNSLSGATLIATRANGAGTDLCTIIGRAFSVQSSTVTSIGSTTISSAASENVFTGGASLNINWAVNQYFIVAVQNASAADSTLVNFLSLTKI